MPVASRHDVRPGEELRRVNGADSRLWAYRLEIVAACAAATTGVTRISRPPGAQWLEPYELGTLPLDAPDLDPAPF